MGLSILAISRKAAELTQEDLAAKVGCDRSHLAQIESGRAPLTLAFAEKLGPLVDMEPAELVVGQLATAQSAAARKTALRAARTLAELLEDPDASAAAKSQAKAILETNLELLEDLAAADQVEDESAEVATKAEGGDEDHRYERDALGRSRKSVERLRDSLGRSRKAIDDDDRHHRDAMGRRR